ncbi:hypothetical protein BCU68_10420 [Vibrio sp. 10N.286.49.B3]|uniref:DUF2860 domain-containing protein n=1 Tax=Vibrio sp. 10N.286.49.B3 TaxID=1880855 RepID=UPI000C83747A|nr:DUF2860 domain-containing protein [Vibrio sp. 10N.286.49.B3]PMH45393.1 hypothetical protein BCU68_10420 [Vibrio sp. 10N.286.49.B3]
MKIRHLSLMISILVSSSSFAKLAEQEGFSGEISFNAGYTSSQSNFNTDNSAIRSAHSDKAETDQGGLFFPLGSVAYTFSHDLNQQVYVGTSRQDIAVGTVALETGYRYQFASRMVVDLSWLPTIMESETWANPYDLDTKRSKTDESGNAYRLQVKSIMGSLFSLDLAYGDKKLDNEQSGDPLLDRNGDSIYAKLGYRQFLSRTMFLMPSVTYINHSADGAAMAHEQWKGELTLIKLMGRHSLAVTAGYAQRDYDALNPEFNRTREDKDLNLFAAYEYRQFMDWQDWSLVAFAGYTQSDSNITFYDKKQLITAIGMNYTF